MVFLFPVKFTLKQLSVFNTCQSSAAEKKDYISVLEWNENNENNRVAAAIMYS